MKRPSRAEVWLVDLNPVRGHEQAGRRPCLILSDDLYNHGPAGKHIVVPVTTKNKGIPYHIAIVPPEGGLRTTSYAMCDDIRCVARERFVKPRGSVSSLIMNAVRESLETLLGW